MTAETRKRGRPRGVPTGQQLGGVRALDRALDILDVIAAGGGLTLSEIAQRLDWPRPCIGCW